MAAQTRDRVYQEERAVPIRDLTETLEWLQDARGGLGMYHAQDRGAAGLLEGGLDLLRENRPAPLGFQLDGDRPAPLGNLHHPVAEVAVVGEQRRISRLQQVDQRRLHPGRSGARHGERHRMRRAEDQAEQPRDLTGEFRHARVEVPDHGGAHRLQDSAIHVARTRPQQQPRGGMKHLGHRHGTLLSNSEATGCFRASPTVALKVGARADNPTAPSLWIPPEPSASSSPRASGPDVTLAQPRTPQQRNFLSGPVRDTAAALTRY